jgi:hypothetical protein
VECKEECQGISGFLEGQFWCPSLTWRILEEKLVREEARAQFWAVAFESLSDSQVELEV